MTSNPALTHQESLLSGEGYDSAFLLPVLLGLVEGLLAEEEKAIKEQSDSAALDRVTNVD